MGLLRSTLRAKAGRTLKHGILWFSLTVLVGIASIPQARAATIITPQLSTFLLTNGGAGAGTNGSVTVTPDGLSFALTGGNSGSGLPGTTTFAGAAPGTGLLEFTFSFNSLDFPGFDCAGYQIGSTVTAVAGSDCGGNPLGTSSYPATSAGLITVNVNMGQSIAFFVNTADNTGEPGILSVTFQSQAVTPTPEPAGWLLGFLGLAAILASRKSAFARFWGLWKPRPNFYRTVLLAAFCGGTGLFAQTQNHYLASTITGQLQLARTVNVSAIQSPQGGQRESVQGPGAETSKLPATLPHPSFLHQLNGAATPSIQSQMQSLAAVPASGIFGFNALSHLDQRNANSGNQFSVEPPNPSIAVANGFILEGVNNAIRVFDSRSGTPLLRVVSSNELFGVAPAINRNTGVNGVFPTDMRVFYDADISRWFVLQRAQDNDADGNPLATSHIYLAVSQTTDPTATYNIYVMDTTNASTRGCPCLPDFPQIGADQYGFYISANEYNISNDPTFPFFTDATILAISKTALAAGATTPTISRFTLPEASGFEFAIQPAAVPPGASQFTASGGVEFFVSSQSLSSSDSRLAIWALSNSASLQNASPNLLLTQTSITVLPYLYPNTATQRPGALPYGSSLTPPGPLAFIDGSPDSRILSLAYAGGRLFATLATQVTDQNGLSLVGGEYAIISPTLRGGVLAASVLKQGYLAATGDHILRPAVAVNSQGRGAIAFTLVGPDYFPSAAFVNIDTVGSPSVIQIVGAGALPEDGFTGYTNIPFPGIARWGDYSTATVDADGSIWMVSEYIPNAPRTQLANWGTFVSKYVP